jgi:hypothetical protein
MEGIVVEVMVLVVVVFDDYFMAGYGCSLMDRARRCEGQGRILGVQVQKMESIGKKE